ncbi:MAG: hypothetical protein LBJ17_00690 [Dysgonamonadaceae bacterium]|jgi:hypothetical protein|nr:hypothetical protein [Dysgonamonadaceae bacterium]
MSENTDENGDYDTGIKPRYAVVNLNVGSTDYKIYCRQGHSADYVFSTTDTYIDPNAGGDPHNREKAVKFSPYNLTNTDITDAINNSVKTGVATDGDYKGDFVDYPTKAGAFFQWASNNRATHAFHPVKYLSQDIRISISSYWNSIEASHETCPSGWRRPNDGVTDNTQADNSNNIDKSEMRQSLYAVPKSYPSSMGETTGRAWGYYADGYFDRRPIVNGISIDGGGAKSAVSNTTKDVAYIGALLFNAANGNRSLFMPAAGSLGGEDYGGAYYSGFSGYYWSSSTSANTNNARVLLLKKNEVSIISDYRSAVNSVRCVRK